MKTTIDKPLAEKKIGYNILRWIVELHIRSNYKFHVVNAEKADNSSPTLFVGNHSNSAIDPLIILFSLKRKVYFIARGDVFKGWKAKVFNYFNMIPIFRREEGPENMSKNEESFAAIFAKLNNRGAVTIYSEGNCLQAAHVRKFRKGTARICAEFELLNTTNIPLNIQVAGLSYYTWDKFRSDVYLQFGNAFTMHDIDFSKANNYAERIHVFNARVESELQNVVLQIPEEFQPTHFLLDEIIGTLPQYAGINKYNIRKSIGEALYAMKPNELTTLKQHLDSYGTELLSANLKHQNTLTKVKEYNLLHVIWLLLTVPVFVLGLVLNAVPFFIPSNIAKNKIKVVEFKASVRIILAFFISIIYFLILSIIAFVTWNWIVGILLFPVSYGMGLLAYEWYKLYEKIMGRKRWLSNAYIILNNSKNHALQSIATIFEPYFNTALTGNIK